MRIFASPPPRFTVPHPALSLAIFLIIEDAIRLAWVRIRQMDVDDFDLANADEDSVTLKLREVLVDEIYNSGDIAGFDDALLQIGTQDAKFRNYDGSKPDMMPDLHIGIIGRTDVRRSQDGVFIECKPIDRNHPAGVDYCSRGIIRFVRGDYAWAMTNAMMVAYAAVDYRIESKLLDALERSKTIVTTLMPQKCDSSQAIFFSDQTYVSCHERNFIYVETGEAAPNIILRHLWLRC